MCACMCGDTNCPSCGPAQGYNPAEERVLEAMTDLAMPDGDQEQDGCDKLVMALGQFPRIAVLLEEVARHMARVNGPLMQDDVNRINERLDKIRPCPKHGEWPDGEYGCVACYSEQLEEEDQ